MTVQMLTAIFKLSTNEADPVQIDAHSELLVFSLWLFTARVPLCKRLMVERQSEHYICAYLAGMKYGVETAQFDSAVAVEEAVKV